MYSPNDSETKRTPEHVKHDKPPYEPSAELAFFPVLLTALFYCFPSHWQAYLFFQFLPQISSFLMLTIWGKRNTELIQKLGIGANLIPSGLRLGTITGMVLGGINTVAILFVFPFLGLDIHFLRNTPHAQIPVWIMVPWFILFIAFFVEVNFRGFLLGRLLKFFSRLSKENDRSRGAFPVMLTVLPLGISTLTFAFDPFMVTTFRHLHWIAVWDGLIWGWLWIRTTNLYVVITAHALEVLIMYLFIRAVLL